MAQIRNFKHIVIDVQVSNKSKLNDISFMYKILNEYPRRIGMTKIMPPYIYLDESPENHGISGFLIITESHISMHTFPQLGYLCLDIFSCRDFNEDDVIKILLEELQVDSYQMKTLDRNPTDSYVNSKPRSSHLNSEK